MEIPRAAGAPEAMETDVVEPTLPANGEAPNGGAIAPDLPDLAEPSQPMPSPQQQPQKPMQTPMQVQYPGPPVPSDPVPAPVSEPGIAAPSVTLNAPTTTASPPPPQVAGAKRPASAAMGPAPGAPPAAAAKVAKVEAVSEDLGPFNEAAAFYIANPGQPKPRKSNGARPQAKGAAARAAAEAAAEASSRMRVFRKTHAPGMEISEDGLTVQSKKGFRTARTLTGLQAGTYACEVTIEKLGESGHARLGFVTNQAELNAPVGFDGWGYGYRDLAGSKMHKGRREAYAEGFQEGDVIGMVIHLPKSDPSANPLSPKKGIAPFTAAPSNGQGATVGNHAFTPSAGASTIPGTATVPTQQLQPLEGSFVAFFKNGVFQGIAYRDLMKGTYFPAASLFTKRQQKEHAVARFNFGPNLSQDYAALEGLPGEARAAIRPMETGEQMLDIGGMLSQAREEEREPEVGLPLAPPPQAQAPPAQLEQAAAAASAGTGAGAGAGAGGGADQAQIHAEQAGAQPTPMGVGEQ